MYADLHLHTRFSDGTFGPEELAAAASNHGLNAIALTDHDTIEGCTHMEAPCQELGIRFITGCEFTAATPAGDEIHILGYCLNPGCEALLDRLSHYQQVRQDRVLSMVARLNEAGVPLSVDVVWKLAGCKSPGRPHIARALVQEGFCSSPDEAFEKYLKKNRPAWTSKEKMPAEEAIELIHEAEGVAVMAHPGLNKCDEVIPVLAEMGLDGLECYHTRHTGSEAARYRRLADELKLLVSGGSDCHGYNKGKPLIGGVRLPYAFVERILERHEQFVGRDH